MLSQQILTDHFNLVITRWKIIFNHVTDDSNNHAADLHKNADLVHSTPTVQLIATAAQLKYEKYENANPASAKNTKPAHKHDL